MNQRAQSHPIGESRAPRGQRRRFGERRQRVLTLGRRRHAKHAVHQRRRDWRERGRGRKRDTAAAARAAAKQIVDGRNNLGNAGGKRRGEIECSSLAMTATDTGAENILGTCRCRRRRRRCTTDRAGSHWREGISAAHHHRRAIFKRRRRERIATSGGGSTRWRRKRLGRRRGQEWIHTRVARVVAARRPEQSRIKAGQLLERRQQMRTPERGEIEVMLLHHAAQVNRQRVSDCRIW